MCIITLIKWYIYYLWGEGCYECISISIILFYFLLVLFVGKWLLFLSIFVLNHFFILGSFILRNWDKFMVFGERKILKIGGETLVESTYNLIDPWRGTCGENLFIVWVIFWIIFHIICLVFLFIHPSSFSLLVLEVGFESYIFKFILSTCNLITNKIFY